MSTIRKYDILVWGATGFTGRLVVAYLIKHYPKVNIAIGGRNDAGLMEVRNTLTHTIPAAATLPMILAESHDYESLFDMAAQTKVLITTVGPYILYGEKLVKACIDAQTHYLDITGEPDFVQDILHKYDADARENGTLVINCCGFDSIPADLGAYYTASLLRSEVSKTIKGYVSFKASFSGGTWASALEAFSKGMSALPKSSKDRSRNRVKQKIAFEKEIDRWVIPMPVIDPWMVKRSAAMRTDVYGDGFSYGQFITRKSLLDVATLLAGAVGAVAGSQLPVFRELMKKIRKSGDGPDEKTRANSYFKVQFIGEGGGRKVRTVFSGGDPGYTETSKMISECAMVILEHYDDLKVKAGIVTPAAALGDYLLERLRKAGLKIEQE
jgi:short subunit dehydrogenase-like uncharacterized protein